MRFSILPLALLVTTVFADDKAILAAMRKIATSTAELNNTVTDFSAGPAGLGDVFPLLISSSTLLHDIKSATKVASDSAPLTILEAIGVAQGTQALVLDTQTVLATILNAKHKFDKLLVISPIVLITLKQQKAATDKFSKAVISKVPADLMESAQALVAPIDVAFDAAIDEYNPL